MRNGELMKKIMISVLASVPLCLVTACASEATGDGPDTAETDQALTTGTCVIQRPIGWSVGGVHCGENVARSTLDLSPGQSKTFLSGALTGVFGSGSLTVQCDANGDGMWHVVSEDCHGGNPL
jgi:hypothetical protein